MCPEWGRGRYLTATRPSRHLVSGRAHAGSDQASACTRNFNKTHRPDVDNRARLLTRCSPCADLRFFPRLLNAVTSGKADSRGDTNNG
jgi:hypothetical protein